MLGDRLSRHIKMLCNGIWRHRLQSDKCDNGPSCGVSDSLKNIPSHFLVGLNKKPNGCKYMRSHSVSQIYFIKKCPSRPQACELTFSNLHIRRGSGMNPSWIPDLKRDKARL